MPTKQERTKAKAAYFRRYGFGTRIRSKDPIKRAQSYQRAYAQMFANVQAQHDAKVTTRVLDGFVDAILGSRQPNGAGLDYRPRVPIGRNGMPLRRGSIF